ncbi:MAG: site-specific tyrosine recombinase XerD [Bacteroidales bacterium]
MNWNSYTRGFRSYLQLEQHLAKPSIEAYLHDIHLLLNFLEIQKWERKPQEVSRAEVQQFLVYLLELGMAATSQARILSGIKAFYTYLVLEQIVSVSPVEIIESPKLKRKLPDVLSVEEIDKIIGSIDLSTSEGRRNKAILETLYACGLRVSELINLQISSLHFEEGFVSVIGKGNKQRLVPIGQLAIKAINTYLTNDRNLLNLKKGSEDIVFLNRRGGKLSRVMIFTIVKQLVEQNGIHKNISPHSFRHSFATHLIEGGADLRAVQDMLGHASITTTEIYTHLDRRFLRDTVDKYFPRK